MKKDSRKDRTAPIDLEQGYVAQGYKRIAGIDEAGRGPWAGNLYAGMVALPIGDPTLKERLHGVRDSKDMTLRQREAVLQAIHDTAVAWGVGFAPVAYINEHGIAKALTYAYQAALDDAHARFGFTPDFLLLDATRWDTAIIPNQNFVKGDQKSLSIACASVLAKHAQHQAMLELAQQHPHYAFEQHNGYGTAKHRQAIASYGVLMGVHRLTFKPIKRALEGKA
jgi:ribonuclease HII